MPDSESVLTLLRRVSRWLFLPAAALVVWGELTPPLLLNPIWDKAGHFVAYFALAAMATLALGLGRRLALSIFGILVLGGALQALQRFSGRDPSKLDTIADALGVVAGLCLAAVYVTLVERPPDDYPP